MFTNDQDIQEKQINELKSILRNGASMSREQLEAELEARKSFYVDEIRFNAKSKMEELFGTRPVQKSRMEELFDQDETLQKRIEQATVK